MNIGPFNNLVFSAGDAGGGWYFAVMAETKILSSWREMSWSSICNMSYLKGGIQTVWWILEIRSRYGIIDWELFFGDVFLQVNYFVFILIEFILFYIFKDVSRFYAIADSVMKWIWIWNFGRLFSRLFMSFYSIIDGASAHSDSDYFRAQL